MAPAQGVQPFKGSTDALKFDKGIVDPKLLGT